MQKRVLAIVLAITMLFICGITAFAVGDQDDPLVPEDKGSLTIHKYLLDDYDFVGGSGQGVKLDEDINETAIALGGVVFDIYTIDTSEPRIGGASAIPPGGIGVIYNLIVDGSGGVTGPVGAEYPFLQVINGTEKTYYNLTKHDPSYTTGDNGSVVAGELSRGYYLVVENKGASNPYKKVGDVTEVTEEVAIAGVVDPFVVAVPMTNPDGTGWIKDVHVYPKNPPITIKKTVDTETISLGDTVTYTLKVPRIPDNIDKETVTEFKVTDMLHKALTLKSEVGGLKDSVKLNFVTANGTTVTLEEGSILQSSDAGGGSFDFESDTYDYYISTEEPDTTTGATELIIRFTKQGLDKISGLMEGTVKGVEFTFEAIVNKNILEIKTDGTAGTTYHTVDNKAEVIFINDDVTYSVESDKVSTDTGEIIIEKVDTEGNPLEDAKFILGRIPTSVDEDDLTEAEYYVKKDGAVSWIADKTKADEVISVEKMIGDSTKAIAVFDGIARHDNGKDAEYYKYFIIETDAPNGYSLLGDPVWATFDKDQEKNYTAEFSNNDLTLTLKIANSKGFTLPITGGMGMIIFTTLGIIMVGISIILIVLTKKKKA